MCVMVLVAGKWLKPLLALQGFEGRMGMLFSGSSETLGNKAWPPGHFDSDSETATGRKFMP